MKVSTILDNIDQGAMALPEFQRGYVWNRNQVRGLIDSMYRGHPVGSLLTWQTKTESADARGDASLQPGTVQLLLDGQQRITSLYGLIRGEPPPFFDGNRNAFTDLRFHLDDELFEFWQPVKMRDDKRWIEVTEVLSHGAGPMIGSLYAEAAGDTERTGRVTVWAERLNRIEQITSREFQIELVTGEDKTVDVVVDIFNRVNSGGTKLSKGDLALAKLCAEWPEARDEFRARLDRWREAGFHFELDWLLRVINAVLTGRAPFTAMSGLSSETIKQGLKDAERAIDMLLNAIASRLGLDHASVLPGIFALPVMAKFVADRGFKFSDHRERDRMLYWYLQAAIWGRFSGSTETVLAQDLLAVTRDEAGDPIERLVANLRQWRGGSLEVTPQDFQAWSKGARFYPVLYLLSRVEGARDWGNGDNLSHHALGRYTDLEVHHIFPKKVLYEADFERAEVNALANFTFLTLETNREISDTHPSQYLPGYVAKHPGAVESHWMPMDPQLHETARYLDFLEQRRELLAAATNSFLSRLWEGEIAEPEPAAAAVPEPEPVAAPTAGAPVASPDLPVDIEEAELAALQAWLEALGVDTGELDYELVDEESGEQLAVLDLAFPRGVQTDLSDPVAVLLNEPPDTLAAASEAGFRAFTDVEAFKQHVANLLDTASETGEGVLASAP